MYNLGEEINSVRTLVEHAEGLTEEAFTNRAVMHRMKSDRSLEVISVDIAGIMNGKTPDIPLKENDVLFIPTRQEKIVERTSPSVAKCSIQEFTNMPTMRPSKTSFFRQAA